MKKFTPYFISGTFSMDVRTLTGMKALLPEALKSATSTVTGMKALLPEALKSATSTVSSVLGGLLLAIVVVACSEDSDDAGQALQQTQPLFMLSADGVGPLNADTPFNLRQVGDAFQNYNVAQETHFLQGDKYPVITVKQRVRPLLSINPDHRQQKVFSIVVHDNLIGNKLGHRIGDKFSEIYDYGKTEECGPGMEEWSGKVMCYAPHTGNILYLFAGSWDGADDQIPPPEVMAEWMLEAIVWKPPER